MRRTHDYEYHYENEGVPSSCRIRIYENGDRPVVVATQQREPEGAHLSSILNSAAVIAAHFINEGVLPSLHLARAIREESVRRQTLEPIIEVAPFVFVEEYLEPTHTLNLLWFDRYDPIGLILDGNVQKQIGNPYRQAITSEELADLIGPVQFVCQCDERFRSACAGLPFYAEHEGKPLCVLHYPGFDEKVYPFDEVIDRKLEEGDLNFRGAFFPYPRSFDADTDFRSAVDFSFATFNEVPDEDFQHTPYFTRDRFHSDVSFHKTTFPTGANFAEVHVEGKADFPEAIFNGPAIFNEGSRFGGLADFSGTTFDTEVDFSEARFGGGIRFLNTEFGGDAVFHDAVFHADGEDSLLDFSRAAFHKDADFGDVRFYAKDVVFSEGDNSEDAKIKFLGEVDFYGASFGGQDSDRTFTGDAYFTDIDFPTQADFATATFHGAAHFWHATFHDEADFYDTKFYGPAHFGEKAKFLAGANFIDAKFIEGGSANFTQAEFGGRVDFDGAFLDMAFFRLTTFKQVTFNRATFGSADFTEATFEERVDFDRATWRDADFSEATFLADISFVNATFQNRARFSEAVFTGRVRFFGTEADRMFTPDTIVSFQDVRVHEPEQLAFHTVLLRPSWFVNTVIRNINFTNVIWYGLPEGPKGSLKDEIGALQSRGMESPSRLLAQTCRELYTNYEEKRDYLRASEFHYWSMDALRREGFSRFGFVRTMYWLLSGYGERPGRAFLMLLLLWGAFTGLYWLFGPERLRFASTPFGSVELLGRSAEHLGQAAVYSLRALARLNPMPRPDVGLFQLLVTLEGILGPLQIALFALALRRKVMR